jgi:hypothetical protein
MIIEDIYGIEERETKKKDLKSVKIMNNIYNA